jgi:hypothetical protein
MQESGSPVPAEAATAVLRPDDRTAEWPAIATLESEADAAYEEVWELHAEVWVERIRLQRIIRHRQDLKFLEQHPLQARFARAVQERIRVFAKSMAECRPDFDWSNAWSLEAVGRLETETAGRAMCLRELLMAAELRWEALHDKLDEARTRADP